MKNLRFNLDSVQISYGDNALNTIIQIEERITDIADYLNSYDELNVFERSEIKDRLAKLVEVNQDIQRELDKQVNKLKEIQSRLTETKSVLEP